MMFGFSGRPEDPCTITLVTFILWQVSLVNSFFDLVVCAFRIQIHCPAEIHQSQVSLAQLLIHLHIKGVGRGVQTGV